MSIGDIIWMSIKQSIKGSIIKKQNLFKVSAFLLVTAYLGWIY